MRRGVLMTLLQQSAMTLPLWIGKPGDKPPPLCGAIPASGDYVARAGHKVAAQVKAVDGDEQWILAEVVSYSHATNNQETHPELTLDHPPAPVEGQPRDGPEALFGPGRVMELGRGRRDSQGDNHLLRMLRPW
ncbi:SAGA-associated factor 29-like [Rhinopithecus roxellana]|uniref:SAGA-associated factor 29-like n=1 Tax=Rhinopithecus roxellana TaxID=61622 RepID=UPI00123764F8|nr:SAGA-associated factor 29-like [Rhinopithecus roxellana]